jgi:carboxymethylenebutenolidase
MSIKGEWIRYGDQIGYFAIPERAEKPLPSVIVIQEAWGVNEHIEDVTRRIAAAGYAALAPDLFAVNGERPAALTQKRIDQAIAFMGKLGMAAMGNPAARDAELAKLPEPERSEVGETFGQIFAGTSSRLYGYVEPLKKAVHHLRTEREETRGQKLGCVGFCMGGGLSALLACEGAEVSGAAIFYGSNPPEEKIPNIACPVIGFYGGNDARISAGLPAFQEAMKKAGKSLEVTVYEGANHGFFNDDRPVYHVRAARDSFAKLLGFFSRNLAG